MVTKLNGMICVNVLYPEPVELRSEPALRRCQRVTMQGTFSIDSQGRGWTTFVLPNSPLYSLYRCVYGRQVEEAPARLLREGSTTIAPRFSPTVIQVRHTPQPGQTLHLRVTGKSFEECAVPMTHCGGNKWEVRFNRPIISYAPWLNNLFPSARTELTDMGFALKHLSFPDFGVMTKIPLPVSKYETPKEPSVTIQVKYAVPCGHTLFIRTPTEKIPLKPVAPDLWEAQLEKAPPSVRVSIDGTVFSTEHYRIQSGKMNLIQPRFAHDALCEPGDL